MSRCSLLGLTLYNFHPGSSLGLITTEQCVKNIAGAINHAHKQVPAVVTGTGSGPNSPVALFGLKHHMCLTRARFYKHKDFIWDAFHLYPHHNLQISNRSWNKQHHLKQTHTSDCGAAQQPGAARYSRHATAVLSHASNADSAVRFCHVWCVGVIVSPPPLTQCWRT